MSHANNKVRWCLAKAKKEIQEGKRHRGLAQIRPDDEGAIAHLKKAQHNFKAVIAFEKIDFPDWAVSAVFYTLYHCFLAIITKHGFESRNQECTISLIGSLKEEKKISISDEIINALKSSDHEERHGGTAIVLRENFQYGTATTIEDNEQKNLKQLCKETLHETPEILFSS